MNVGSKSRSLGQIIEDPVLVTKGLGFKSLLFNAIQHNSEGSGEQLQGHHGPLCLLECYTVNQIFWQRMECVGAYQAR